MLFVGHPLETVPFVPLEFFFLYNLTTTEKFIFKIWKHVFPSGASQSVTEVQTTKYYQKKNPHKIAI